MLARDYECTTVRGKLFVRVSLAGIEPVGFRVKSDLRNHQAIAQPRLYDCLMVTQITLRVPDCHGTWPAASSGDGALQQIGDLGGPSQLDSCNIGGRDFAPILQLECRFWLPKR